MGLKCGSEDTAGQERYRTITTAYYRGAMGFILMYDVTNEDSFNSVQDWSTQIKTYSWDNAQVILVGNKCDMEDERVILLERGKQLADQLGLEFFETSAKDNVNVKAVFERLVDIICDKMSESLDSDPTIVNASKGTRLTENPAPQNGGDVHSKTLKPCCYSLRQDGRHSHVTFIATVCLGAKELGRYGFGRVFKPAKMSVKAFELVPAVEKIDLMGEKSKTVIECLECCGKNLYIGTNDCFIVHYKIEEKVQPNGKVLFKSEKQAHKYLNMRKPITALKAASAINKIFVLCDGNLMFLSMFNLEIIQSQGKIKGVTAFCHNENPHGNNPFCVQICVAKKKQIQMFSVTEDKVIHIKDISIPEPPNAVAMDGNFICVAMSTQYNVINSETGHRQDLFPYDSDSVSPLVKRINKEEFLLNGPSSLGVFVTAAGMSERPPIQWNENVYAVAYSHPYVLSLSNEFVTVHSILDQQPKQIMAFKGGCWLDNFDGRLYVASRTIIYGLVPIPWEKQVQALLGDKRVDEALELAKYANKAGLSKEQFDKIFKKIKLQAGFIELAQLEFIKAKEFFQSGVVDIKEVISLYPGLLPTASPFTRSVPPLHDIADIQQLCKGQQDMLTQYKLFLMNYLEEEKNTYSPRCIVEIDNALMKLYAEINSPELNSFIESSNGTCASVDCVSCLEQYSRFHALALLYCQMSQPHKALNLWKKLLDNEIVDNTFPGIDFVITYLSKLKNCDLIWKYSECILEKDELLGVTIFTDRDRDEDNTKLKPEMIVEFLHRFPKAVMKYLEYLIYDLKIQLNEHEKALKILVFELEDYSQAEEYCVINSDRAHQLMSFDFFSKNQDELLVPALTLLNSNNAEFDSVKVLKMIPENWSVHTVNSFLKRTLRKSLHKKRMLRTEKALSRCEDLQVQFNKLQLNRQPVILSDDEICDVCSKPFVDAQCTRFPNGIITHVQCAKNKIICPISGKLFKGSNNPFEES
ncbi:Transforming growth factor-beta receptor-associated protein 1 [Nymphon striatum]|nr:Transforming growth factor-beta receptor-associated protein 1 [Nymphon striatum]